MMRLIAIAILVSAAAFAPFLLAFGMSSDDGMHVCPFAVSEGATCIGAVSGIEQVLHHIGGFDGLFQGLVGWVSLLLLLGIVSYTALRSVRRRLPVAQVRAMAFYRHARRLARALRIPRKSARLLARWRALCMRVKKDASAGVFVRGVCGVAAAR